MYFLNLSLAQFVALFGAISVTMVLLYLLGRSRRKQVVATLRFWVAAEQPAVVKKRKRIQQPLSLILQLLRKLRLLLATAQLRLRSRIGRWSLRRRICACCLSQIRWRTVGCERLACAGPPRIPTSGTFSRPFAITALCQDR